MVGVEVDGDGLAALIMASRATKRNRIIRNGDRRIGNPTQQDA